MMGAGSSGVQKIQEQGRKVQKSLAPSPNAGPQKPPWCDDAPYFLIWIKYLKKDIKKLFHFKE